MCRENTLDRIKRSDLVVSKEHKHVTVKPLEPAFCLLHQTEKTTGDAAAS